MKISKIDRDFKLYIETEDGQYLSSDFIKSCESTLDKQITFAVKLEDVPQFPLNLTRDHLKTLSDLLANAVELLEKEHINV